MTNPRGILITGASSGLGKALALAYAASDVRLHLAARNAERLHAVAEICRAQGAEVTTAQVDVTDENAVRAWVAGVTGTLDLVFANAGISAGGAEKGIEPFAQSDAVFHTNIDGVRYTVEAAIEKMRPQGHGQIAIISSLAGFRGLPGSASYSASKAAVRVWGEALRGSLARVGIRLSVICPGYIVTPMTDKNAYRMPFLMPVEKATAIIQRGLRRDKARIVFPFGLWAIVWLLSVVPPGWTDPIFNRMPEKGRLED
ncbi:MAG: SDR family NAD(P)-dependent oxidoreductase [Alphaproteobacteria bacterium]|nr:SDR family NAD(P)-dependent oxidoreductase [Alphaproteobacteria bacterium]MDA7988758.1 SDR family NAD(P)-dependent oxidoreductase [Alphaproteobacteria bacterium]MDA8031909.1 SDR family NAD(P)-dependent oxidoreductase [Alphaproteobacteria bacterium]